MKRQTKTLTEKLWDANEKASCWLAEYNQAIEQGKEAKAEKCLTKAQYWLDKVTEYEGRA